MIWGALHGTVLMLERIWARYRPEDWPELPRSLMLVVTFHVVLLGWIFFRAESFDAALAFLGGLFASGEPSAVATPLAVALILFGLAIHFTPPTLAQGVALRARRLPAPALGLAAGALILIVDALRFEGVAPFIYYQF